MTTLTFRDFFNSHVSGSIREAGQRYNRTNAREVRQRLDAFMKACDADEVTEGHIGAYCSLIDNGNTRRMVRSNLEEARRDTAGGLAALRVLAGYYARL